MDKIVGVAEFAVLALLPGAWIACGLPICSLPFWAKLFIGAVISPLVVVIQFYIVRLVGVPFALAPHVLVALNLPALLLVARRVGRPSLPGWRLAAGWALVLFVPLASLAPTLLDPQTRIYTGHAWMYSDPIYLFARGDLVPEDPEVAGLRLAYPWAGLLYQGVLSYVINSPPAASYIWTNVVSLVFIAGLCAGIVGELGGGRFARTTSLIWLLFGVNVVGYALEQVTRHLSGRSSFFFGDYRYTPWYLKFFFFQQEPVALGILLAVVYVLVRRWPGGLSRAPLVLLGWLLCDLAIIYPILMPAALAIVGAKMAAAVFDRYRRQPSLTMPQIVGLAAVLAVGGLVTLASTKFVTVDVVAPTVHIAPFWWMRAKAIAGLVVLSPLLVGLLVVARTQWRALRHVIVFLSLGAAGSYFLFVVFQLPGFGAEYKFILTAAVCLAPFPALAVQPLVHRLGRAAVPAFAALTFVLVAPLVHKLFVDWPWFPAEGLERTPPLVNLDSFDLRLASTEPMAGVVDAIRQQTTTDTLVIAAHADLHLPTLTARSMYAPPAQSRPHPGVNIKSADMLVEAKGYDTSLLANRASNLRALFDPADPTARQGALDQMLALKRPLAIILDGDRDSDLLQWLRSRADGRLAYEGSGHMLWLVPASVA